MASYESFAQVYDIYMDTVPYEQWCQNILGLFEKYGVATGGTVVDLGCGTGAMSRLLAGAGFSVIGVDLSEEMLGIAANKDGSEGILYVCQDMTDLELAAPVPVMVSLCDSMNYLVEDGALEATLARVKQFLEPGGIFIFDMNTAYKYEHILADNTFTETREEGSFIWENEFDEESRINTYYLTLYVATDEGNGSDQTFHRFMEEHYQRAFAMEEITTSICESGLELLAVLDADTLGSPSATSERLYYICKN